MSKAALNRLRHPRVFSGFVIVMGLAISLGNMWYARRLQRDIDVLDTLVAAE